MTFRSCLAAFSVLGGALWLGQGCASDDGGGGSSSGGAAGDAAAACPGVQTCVPQSAECFHSGVTINAGAPAGAGVECMAKRDNSAQDVLMFRLSQLDLESPVALAKPFMQEAIVTKRIDLGQKCCFQHGEGRYNVLFAFDTTTKKVTTGGGPPQRLIGEPKDGTCYAEFTDTASSRVVQPIAADYIEEADGSLNATFPSVVVPIYLSDDPTSYVLLPLNDLQVSAKLSADKSCIGKFRTDVLDPIVSCAPRTNEVAWENGGSYDGYITVAEAEQVEVHSLGMTLCVVLTDKASVWKGPLNRNNIATCEGSTGWQQSGNKMPEGDWCSTTKSAGGCKDSWRVVAKFAASAIDIKGTYRDNGTCN